MKTRRVVLIVLLVAVMLFNTAVVMAQQGGTHTVQTGENLYRIALKYGLTVEQIAAANGITNPDKIYIGQVLVIPGAGGTGGPVGSTVSYTVVTGDTLFSIAQRNGTNVDTLVALNGLDDADVLFIGQVILIPAGGSYTGTGGPTTTATTPAATGERFTYKVERGVTLSHIAYFYNTTIQQIALLNNLDDTRFIVEGQELLIQGIYREGSPLEVGGPGWFPEGTTGTGTTTTTGSTASPTTGPILSMTGDGAVMEENRIYFVLLPAAEKKCVTITSSTNQAFSVTEQDAATIAFNPAISQTTEEPAFILERPDVAMYIDLSFDGGVKPDGCSGDPLICDRLTYTLCAAATPDALTGGHEYLNDVLLRFGTQLYDQFYDLAQTPIPLKFQVPSPE